MFGSRTWILHEDFDVVCVQEQNLHLFAPTIAHYHQYPLFYGGMTNGSSNTLTIIKDTLSYNEIERTQGFTHWTSLYYTTLIIGNIHGLNCDKARTNLELCYVRDTTTTTTTTYVMFYEVGVPLELYG